MLNQEASETVNVSVLLVDDQESIAQAIADMLRGEKDIVLHICHDPAQAIQIAQQVRPTVILQDLVMPQMDGFQLASYFRAHPQTKEIPVIVLSTKEDPAIKARAFAAGANDYLVKLPDRVELLARLRYHSNAYLRLLERNRAYGKLRENQEGLERDLADAAEYVRSCLPKPIHTPEFQIDARFLPSTTLGGDAFGYYYLDETHFAIYLLDVCGHGVGAALLSVTVANVLRLETIQVDFKDPAVVLEALNRRFQMEQHRNMFFTMWYGVYCIVDRTLTYASAGHPPAVLVRLDETKPTERLCTPGLVIGALPNTEYKALQVQIEPKDTLFIFSDGLCELFYPDGRMLEFDKLVGCMQQLRARINLDHVLAFAHEVHGPTGFNDDVSLVQVVFG